MDEYNYFGFHKLNGVGQTKAQMIQTIFEDTLKRLDEHMTGHPRAATMARTKMEEACFFAKKAMATDKRYQEAIIQPPVEEDKNECGKG